VNEDVLDSLLRPPDALLPEDRLADPRLAGDKKRRRTLIDLIQEGLDRVELLVTSDDRRGLVSHLAADLAVVPPPVGVASRPASSPRELIPSFR
jgi:hypothetical protein